MIPVACASNEIQVTNWNPDNSSCNGIIEISNSTGTDTWTIILYNVTQGVTYNLYSLQTELLVDSCVASENATLIAENLTNGVYWIVEDQEPSVEFTYWNPNNVSCNAILSIHNSSRFNTWNFTISNTTQNAVYKLYRQSDRVVIANASIINGKASIITNGLVDGEYRIAETGLERILISYWNPSNST